MAKPHTKFGKPSWALEALGGEEGGTEQAVDFQFSITWSSLYEPLPASKPADAVVPMNHRVPTLVTALKEPPPPREETALAKQQMIEEPPPLERPKMDGGSTVSWEMVVPKMIRPALKAPRPEIAPPTVASEEKTKSRLQLNRLAIAVAITLVGILVLVFVHRWVSGPKPAPTSQAAASALKLAVDPKGNGVIDIRWNPQSAAVAQAKEARLVVVERDQQPRTVALDAEQLKTGHLSYGSATERVVVRLEVVDRAGVTTKESTLALLPEIAPAPAPQAPSGTATNQHPIAPAAPVQSPKPKVDLEPVEKLSGPQAGRPLIRSFTPPRRVVGDPGERPALLPEPPAAIPSASSTATIHLPESGSRISPPPAPTKSPTPAAEPVKVGGNLQAAKLIKRVTPVYPPMAGIAHIQGMVRLTAVIGKDGTIQNLQPVSGPSLLIKAATDAVKQWVYQPTILNGQPVEVQTQIDINFNLNQ